MTDQINDQISAFIDDELSPDESAMLVRRFERDSDARARALRYTMIGAALRGEMLEPNPSVLRRRVAAALNGTPATTTATRVPSRWTARVARPALGIGIAAGAAVAAIGLLRVMNEIEAPTPAVVSTQAPAVPLQVQRVVDEGPAYVVPPDVAQGRAVTPPIRLTNYLMHHGEYASGLSRTTVHSNVVSATDMPAETDAAEGTR
jgi:anti-sigma factor RsiW